MGVVVAYRDQFRITDDADPLGAARVRGFQQQVRLSARVAWQRVEYQPEVHDQSPAPANERLRALATSERRDQIAAGDALRRLKAARRSSDAIRAYDTGRLAASARGPRM